MQASQLGDLEIERRLERYAQARLSPTADGRARMRARVMREARLAIEIRKATPREAVVEPAAGWGRRRAVRRGGALLLAAGLAAGIAAGAVSAAQPGGPLYGTRIWLESAALPSGATARADAELARLDARVAEFEQAAQTGDQAGVEAALRSYGQIADEALAGAAGDADQVARLTAAFDRHMAVLTAVAGDVPEQAQAAIERNIERAIERNEATLDRINAARPATGGPPSTKPDKPNAAATPQPTPKPKPTPAAGSGGAGGNGGGGNKPAPTPKADHTPRGSGGPPTP